MPSAAAFDAHPQRTAVKELVYGAAGDEMNNRATEYIKGFLISAAPAVAERIALGSEGGPWGSIIGAVIGIATVIWDEVNQASNIRFYQQRYEIERVRRSFHAQ